ncbi:MAG: NADH-quinone oxidoreductase subunit NuoF [Deltaproteobacteria bacterium]|nr:NADH-quinone oxidoreductase subunit NuoF [Deltaproteobacteria bacterium]
MYKITVGMATCGISAGAEKVYKSIETLIKDKKDVKLAITGCMGMCYKEPLVEIFDGKTTYLYGDIDEKKVQQIFESHIQNNTPIDELIVLKDYKTGPEQEFTERQYKIVLRNCGLIDPDSIEEYEARDGYKAIRKVITSMTPDEVIDVIIKSGLRGRGGAGFLTGQKWKFARASVSDQKYVICNADEGDPGAFMDRSVLEGDPHSVIEGMMICGYAIGATQGYIYCRAEYPLAVKRLKKAIKLLEEKGYLGDNLFGSNFSFRIKLKEGAGAFVCGEETALMASIEGKRGTPRPRPPYPAVKGLWGKPTNINNVETFANVPWIILNGWEKFASMGTEKSKGTKVFAIAGKAVRTGLVEVPMGITIRDIVFNVCGGIKDGKKFKAVQIGGPSGGCIPESLADTQIDYEQITKTGAIMGSGGLVIMDETTCMVEMARFFLNFTQLESCGKCTSCRIGTLRMLEILERIVDGKGEDKDIEKLEELGEFIKKTSQCGLGQTAPNPVLTTIKYFRDEYEAHIKEKRCPAHSCGALVKFIIIPEKCTGCMVCARQCPVNCIIGEKKKPHVIDQSRCTRCGKCFTVCNFDAILKD